MVLEEANVVSLEKRPWLLFFIAFCYTILAIALATWVFQSHATLVMVFFCVIVSIPIIRKVILMEEKKDMMLLSESNLLKEHFKAFNVYFFLFLGFCAGFLTAYLILPISIVTRLFSVQIHTISNFGITGAFTERLSLFSRIIINNMKVMSLSILFSFVYGAGALFIIVWNSSVISAAIGNFIRSNLSTYADFLGLRGIANYLKIFSIGFFRYMTHGILEMSGYFVAAIAGGILSFAIIKNDFRTKRFENVLYDVSDLILIAIAIIFVAGVVEVFVTPLLFK